MHHNELSKEPSVGDVLLLKYNNGTLAWGKLIELHSSETYIDDDVIYTPDPETEEPIEKSMPNCAVHIRQKWNVQWLNLDECESDLPDIRINQSILAGRISKIVITFVGGTWHKMYKFGGITREYRKGYNYDDPELLDDFNGMF